MVVRIGDRDTRREDGEIVEFTAVERKVDCAHRPDNDTKGGVLGLEQGLDGRLHLDLLVAAATLMVTLTFACWLISSTMPFSA